MPNSTRRVILALSVSLLILMAGCKARTTAASGTGGGGSSGSTPLTAAQIAGTAAHTVCIPITDNSYGSALYAQNYMWYRSISFDATSMTYSTTTTLYQGTNSTCYRNTEIFVYWQSGTFELGSVASSGATEITYTTNPVSDNNTDLLTAYPAGWVTQLTQSCPHITTFTSTSWLVAGDTCDMDNLSLPEFPNDSTTYFDLVQLDSTTSPTKFIVSPSLGIFNMGQYSSYPASASFDYTY